MDSPSLNLQQLDPATYVDRPDSLRALVTHAFESGDRAYIMNAIRFAIRARGIPRLEKQTGLSPATLYKAFKERGNPTFDTMLAVLKALGLKMNVHPSDELTEAAILPQPEISGIKWFYAVLHHDEGSSFGITFPELPGCFAAADHIRDVIPNAADALELWFEDAEEVEPASLDDIRTSAAEHLAEGAIVTRVPYLPDRLRTRRGATSKHQGTGVAIDDAYQTLESLKNGR